MPLIEVRGLSHNYANPPLKALRNISLDIESGEYVAIVGANGSGKSTLIRHLNGLLLPSDGCVRVSGLDTRDPAERIRIREKIGMVFQSPEEQIIASVVEEDVAFGPENLGVPREQLKENVRLSLERVGMYQFRHRPPHLLSAGQQQRIAVAGALAMDPLCLVLDEATSMLDPMGRRDLHDILLNLNREGRTIITVTHSMEEVLDAKRALVLHRGEIVFDGSPAGLFEDAGIARWGLQPPAGYRLAAAIRCIIPEFSPRDYTPGEMAREIAGRIPGRVERTADLMAQAGNRADGKADVAVSFESVSHTYLSGTCLASQALEGVTFRVPRNSCHVFLGVTGSGKSTVLQHCNALLFPNPGRVISLGVDTLDSQADLRALRRRAGLALQRPETQIFERYIGDDVAYGPRQAGIKGVELTRRVRKAMETAGLPFGQFKDRPAHSLSGGEKRKAALAGVFALEPEMLLLDEPTAGLDPVARESVLELIAALGKKGITMLIATHDIEAAAELASSVHILSGGALLDQGNPEKVFYRQERKIAGLSPPLVVEVWEGIRHLFKPADMSPVSTDALIECLVEAVSSKGAGNGNGTKRPSGTSTA